MRRALRPGLVVALALGLAAPPAALAGDGREGAEGTPSAADPGRRLLAEAFERRYGADLSARIELVMRDARGRERRRLFRTVTAYEDGRMRSVGRLLEPASLRGLALLTVEAAGREDDTFVYLPALGRARRIGMGRRSDSFLGSDLTYADFERHRVEDYRVEGVRAVRLQDERAWIVTTRPRRAERFARVAFGVARRDRALLAVRYYRPGNERPARRLAAPRESFVEHGRFRIPTRLEVRSPERGTETFVRVRDLEVAPEIDDRVFSVVTLESERSLDAAVEGGAADVGSAAEDTAAPEGRGARSDASARTRPPRTPDDGELR